MALAEGTGGATILVDELLGERPPGLGRRWERRSRRLGLDVARPHVVAGGNHARPSIGAGWLRWRNTFWPPRNRAGHRPAERLGDTVLIVPARRCSRVRAGRDKPTWLAGVCAPR